MINVLYIHGMGGGADSRIPSILKDVFSGTDIGVVVRTYDFDPETAHDEISMWVKELKPSLIIGESLGSLHALRIKNVPHLLVSPALNAPIYFNILAWLTFIPGVTWIFDRIYKPREGDRQQLHFTFSTLRKYSVHRKKALDISYEGGSSDYFHAFIGTHDHYRKSGIVSLKTWKKYFGDSFTLYEGTHFMADEYISAILAPCICNILKIKQENINV